MNPQYLCKYACANFDTCELHPTTNTTVFEHKTNGVNCDNLESESAGIDLPYPYVFVNDEKKEGVFKTVTKVKNRDGDSQMEISYTSLCKTPVWVDKTFIDPYTNEHYVQITVIIKNHIIERIVSLQDVLTTNGLKGLTRFGLNVPENSIRDLESYFSNYIAYSKTISEESIYSKFGWTTKYQSFVIGKNNILIDSVADAFLTSDINTDTYKPYEPKGTPTEWVDNVRGLLQYDNVRFVCYAACTALVLKLLGGSSFIFEIVADTSKGKTIMAELAMSIFGDPDALKLATDVSKVFLERTCSTCNDLPVFLDETSMIRPEILKEMAYMVGNERGKGRGKKDGGVDNVDRWKSVVLTTGEVPLTNSSSLGGQDVRIVSLYGGIGEYDPTNVEKYKDAKNKTYGTIAPLLIQKILNDKHLIKEIYTKCKESLKSFSKNDTSGVMGRVVNTYALLATAGFVFESVLEDVGEQPINAVDLVKKMFCDKLDNSDGSLPDRAFSIILDWVTQNRRCFCDDKEGGAGDRYELYGNISMAHPKEGAPYDYVDIIPSKFYNVLDAALEHKGISKRILSDWNDAGKIVTSKDGKNTISARIKLGDKPIRVIRLKSPLGNEAPDYDF